MNRVKKIRIVLFRPAAICALMLVAGAASAQEVQRVPDVTAIPLEDLMNLTVTSVSKRAQKLADAPAAIFVITQDDIRRSGARNIPEALRLAPGVEVAQIDRNKWAITSRGFNGRFANKLLVLIDGRSVYTPLFSGVFWNVQDVMIEDIDRIEVIRGPGATLWGANAVNGVINIITKPAQATQGGIVSTDAGNASQGTGVRFGGKIGARAYYRAYSKYFNWESSTGPDGSNASDGWDSLRGGFRIDAVPSLADTFTLQADIYRTEYGETLTTPALTPPYRATFTNDGGFTGGSVLGRWDHAFLRSSTSVQMYYDRSNTDAASLLEDHRDVFDLDFQHDIQVAEYNELIWGMGYRLIRDRVEASPSVSLDPDARALSLFSAFVQDELGFFDDRLTLTFGTKLEHNDFTGFEVGPNARALWNVGPKQSVWAAISRAVRTPARTEADMRLNAAVLPPSPASAGLPVMVRVLGSDRFGAENLVAYEAGYRVQPTPALSLDFSTFYNSYDDLLSAEPLSPSVEISPLPVHIVAPLVAANKMAGATYGAEMFADWKVLPNWRISGSYSFLDMNIRRKADSLDQSTPDPSGSSPSHQFYVRSSLELFDAFEPDFTLRRVGELSGLGIPGYYSLDAHLSWRPDGPLEISIGGRNLFDHRHLEFRPDFIQTTPTEVKRTFHAALTLKF